MTLFAGVVQLRRGESLPAHFAQALQRELSRHPKDRPRLFSGDGFAFAHGDLGLLEGAGVCSDADGRISLLAGEPLSLPAAGTRADDLGAMHEAWCRADRGPLAAARGYFCAAHADTRARRVRLVADKLGLRPLHYALIDGMLIFATSIRVMLALAPPLAASSDLTAQAQLAALGYVLGERTPYASIRTVEAGQVVDIDATGAERAAYWSWDGIETSPELADDEFGARLHQAFCTAVRLRRRGDSSVVAQLSGGLDSRCVVAELRGARAQVHTLNYAPAGSADMVLGRMAAQRLGCLHFELPRGREDFWDRMVVSHSRWRAQADEASLPRWPSRIWTGIAGEAVLAGGNLTEAVLSAMAEGRIDDAIDAYLESIGGRLPGRLFLRHRRQAMQTGLRESMRAEIARRTSRDPARRYHIHNLVNEVRGDLAAHHENLDLRRIELVMPFCDAEFVALALTLPLPRALRHGFYQEWLGQFGQEVTATPWQAYPWSRPCPLPMPPGLRGQWAEGWFGRDDERLRVREELRQAMATLGDQRFPDTLLDRRILRIACWLVRFGMTRYLHLLKAARVFVLHAPLVR